jgi:hypothetical protein
LLPTFAASRLRPISGEEQPQIVSQPAIDRVFKVDLQDL